MTYEGKDTPFLVTKFACRIDVRSKLHHSQVSNNPVTSYGALGVLETLCKNKENVLRTLDMSVSMVHLL
jgi:hypothetical protein